MTLNEAIKKSIQAYFAGTDIHRGDSQYTIDKLNAFEQSVNGDKKSKAKVKPSGSPSTAPSVTDLAPQGIMPEPLHPMKPPTKTNFLDAVKASDHTDGQNGPY